MEYGWSFWYYGGLHQDGKLVSAAKVTAGTLSTAIWQHFVVNLPIILFAFIALVVWGRRTIVAEIGFTVGNRKKLLLPGGVVIYLLALVVALRFTNGALVTICYQWFYYLVFISFMEELTFRGLFPFLIEKSKLPDWTVWVVPGVLFASMHTLLPVIYNGFSFGVFVANLLSLLVGNTIAHCGFYALRRWSGTIWLPILVHGLLDFLSVF